MKTAIFFVLGALLGSTTAHQKRAAAAHKRGDVKATVITTCQNANEWAVTLDDGPYIYQKDILALAKKYNAPLTMFNNGDNWNCIYDQGVPEAMQELYKSGLILFGNHMWLHNDATTQTSAEFLGNLTKLDHAYAKILGITPNYHRFPYGAMNSARLADLASAGYPQTMYWSVDSRDGLGDTVPQQEATFKKAIAAGKPTISLNHAPHKHVASRTTTVFESLPFLLQHLSKSSYKMVSLEQCTGIKPYRHETGVMGKRDSTWHC